MRKLMNLRSNRRLALSFAAMVLVLAPSACGSGEKGQTAPIGVGTVGVGAAGAVGGAVIGKNPALMVGGAIAGGSARPACR